MRHRLFQFIASISARQPWVVVIAAALLTVTAAVYAASTITLNADLDRLVSEELDYHRRYLDFLEEFGDQEYLYVVVEIGGDLPRAKRFLTDLGERLGAIDDVKEIVYKIDNPAMEKGFLLYIPMDELATLKEMLTRGALDVRQVARWDGIEPFFRAINNGISGPVDVSREKELETSFTFLNDVVEDMSAAIERGAPYDSNLQALFFGDGETFDPDGFLRNGDLLFLMLMPVKDFTTMEVIAGPLERIRLAIDETKAGYPGIRAGLTGRPVLAADELATTDRDMTRATMIAIALVGALFIVFFRSVTRPMLAMISLIMGITWTFGLVALIFGSLTILSIVFALILVGASIEYAIHLVARYQEELARGRSIDDAMADAIATAGRSDLTSACTTAAAFLTVTWTDFTALAELGFIAAAGVMLCLAAMMVVLPAMIIVCDRRRSAEQLKAVRPFGIPHVAALYRRPRTLIASCIVATVVVVPFALRTGFDNNLLNLQARGLESVELEHLIIEKSSETTWFANSVADTVEESRRKAAELRKLPTVRRVDDIERVVPKDQDVKIAVVRAMAPAFANLSFVDPADSIDREQLAGELGRLLASIARLTGEAFSAGRPDAVDELDTFAARVERLKRLVEGSSTNDFQRLVSFQREFVRDLHDNIALLATGMSPSRIAIDDIPPSIAKRFISPAGRYALTIYPRENIWDPASLAAFIAETTAVDPDVVGTPIEVHESGRLMRATFMHSAVLAFAVIFLMVWIDFRKVRPALMAVMPLAVGTVWLVGLMGMLGVPFNMANFFAIPILIGIGVDNGVHLVHRMERDGHVAAIGTSTGKGVLLTALSNAIGFGAMMMAAHRGIASLGAIMALGGMTLLAAALIAMPPVAHWVMRIPIAPPESR